MSDKKRIACFFTAGYTELNAMKIFMQKINENVNYIQLCPCGPRKSKSAIQGRQKCNVEYEHNGLTGDSLIQYIVKQVQEQDFLKEYDAILIEDDKDYRFMKIVKDGTADYDVLAWEQHKEDVRKQIHKICPDIKIIFFYAAPEVEAWFLADFDNSFGYAYRNTLSTKENDLFAVRFRKYINDNILTERYKECIEQYGYFEGVYNKLSEKIQGSLVEKDFLKEYRDHNDVHYSKRRDGETMLRMIQPENVIKKCNYYFREGYLQLKDI